MIPLLENMQEALTDLQGCISYDGLLDRVQQAAQLLDKANLIVITGMGKSGYMAQKAVSTLRSLGHPAVYLEPSLAAHGDLGLMCNHSDVILAVSHSGETDELRPILTYAAEHHITIISITSNSNSTLARASQIHIEMPRCFEPTKVRAPMISTIMQLLILDGIAYELGKGIEPAKFYQHHPAGSLGRALSDKPPSQDNTAVIIPVRMGSTRLYGKPMIDLGGGVPMYERIYHRAVRAKVGMVAVATPDAEILEDAKAKGIKVIETSPKHQSGTDRVAEAIGMLDLHRRISYVINLQGDMPDIRPSDLKRCLLALELHDAGIGTLAAPLLPEDVSKPSKVKVIADLTSINGIGLAQDFNRLTHQQNNAHLHVGCYAYRRTVLERFVSMPQAKAEQHHKLEQLRAVGAGIKIAVASITHEPMSIDTEADLNAFITKYGREPDNHGMPELQG